MYAQLCKRLADYVPNFDPPDKVCTFRRLLLSKCRDEFENRAHNAQDKPFSSSPGTTTPGPGSAGEDCSDEAKYMAKRKMLGNIKFIGELGKLQIVHDSILHQCCQKLLVGRKKQPIPDQAEDLECLCHLMRTCGRILDTPKAKALMDQYFSRLVQAAENDSMPLRIRFMIQDIIEMRRNRWLPRKVGKAPEGPRTIQQVREDAYRDGCIYLPQQSPPHAKSVLSGGVGGLINPLEGSFFDSNKKRASGMEDLFGPYPSGGNSYLLGTGPGTISTDADENSLNGYGGEGSRGGTSGGYGNTSNGVGATGDGRNTGYGKARDSNGSGDFGGGRGFQSNREKLPDFGDRYSANRTKDRERRQRDTDQRGDPLANGNANEDHRRGVNGRYDRYGPKPEGGTFHKRHQQADGDAAININNLPPRFKKLVMSQQHQSGSGHASSGGKGETEGVSLRPQLAANNMLFKPKTPSMLPKSAISKTADGFSPLGENSLLAQSMAHHQSTKVMMQPNEPPPIIIKQDKADKARKDKNRSQKGPTREEVFTKMEAILGELLEHRSVTESAESWRENDWLPSKMSQTAVTHFFKIMLAKAADEDRQLAYSLIGQLAKDGNINSTHCLEALAKILNQHLAELEKDCDNPKSRISTATAWMLEQKLINLKELGEIQNGPGANGAAQNHPILLQTLQNLHSSIGQERLKKLFDDAQASGFALSEHVPPEFKTEDKLIELLEEYQLAFLMPLLSVQKEMVKQLAKDPNPSTFSQWLVENVSSEFHAHPSFVVTLFGVIFSYIYETTSSTANISDSSQSLSADKAEREMLTKFRPVLHPFVQNKPQLQLTAVYALQVFALEKKFPKGLLLRSFIHCYELDIIEERAFLQWKDDLNDAFPGKGKALFQVNQWLTWLEEAESDEEEDDDDDD